MGNETSDREVSGMTASDMDRDEGIAYLSRDGGRVPCSRYGHDSASCAPVAYRLAELIADANGTPIDQESLDACMGLVVNDHEDVATILTEHGGTPDDYELAAYECSICGDPHGESAHGEPLVMRDTGRDTLTGFVGTVLADASALIGNVSSGLTRPERVTELAGLGTLYPAGRALTQLAVEWDAHTDDERDEFATEYLDDIDVILSDAGYHAITDGDQGTWVVYAPVSPPVTTPTATG